MAHNIRIDITCDLCGGSHDIFVLSNRVGYARSLQYECLEKHNPTSMAANAFRSMEAVPALPAEALLATVVQ